MSTTDGPNRLLATVMPAPQTHNAYCEFCGEEHTPLVEYTGHQVCKRCAAEDVKEREALAELAPGWDMFRELRGF